MEKFLVKNSNYETLLLYDASTQLLYIKIGFTGKVFEYREVSQALFKKLQQQNKDNKGIGLMIMTLNNRDITGTEVPATKIEWE